jgi:hypothetical protein
VGSLTFLLLAHVARFPIGLSKPNLLNISVNCYSFLEQFKVDLYRKPSARRPFWFANQQMQLGVVKRL